MITYNAAISASGEGLPNVISYSALISACEKGPQTRQALHPVRRCSFEASCHIHKGPGALGPGRWARGPGRWARGAGTGALGPGPGTLGPWRWARVAGRWARGAGPWARGAGPGALGAAWNFWSPSSET